MPDAGGGLCSAGVAKRENEMRVAVVVLGFFVVLSVTGWAVLGDKCERVEIAGTIEIGDRCR